MATRGALLVGLLSSAVSAYWGAGGTRLLDTVGGVFQHAGHNSSPALITVVWAAVALKLLAAVLGPLAVHEPRGPRARRRHPWTRAAAWTAAAVLVLYGGVQSITGWLVQLGVVAAGASADHRALRWHAYLWDPWFLVWGGLLTLGLACSRPARPPATARSLGSRVRARASARTKAV